MSISTWPYVDGLFGDVEHFTLDEKEVVTILVLARGEINAGFDGKHGEGQRLAARAIRWLRARGVPNGFLYVRDGGLRARRTDMVEREIAAFCEALDGGMTP